jgi:restriction system protein
MTIWLIRAGAHGEYEQKFISENRVYLTWDRLLPDLSKLSAKQALLRSLAEAYPDSKPKRLQNWASQIWPFAHEIKKGDLVVMPLKSQASILIGEMTGEYRHEPTGTSPFYHWRSIKWLSDPIPRTHFGQDLLYTFGAFLTICRIKRNDAEARITTMRKNGWLPDPRLGTSEVEPSENTEAEYIPDLEQTGRDLIAKLIGDKVQRT